MTRKKRISPSLFALIVSLSSGRAQSQETPATPILHSETRVVQIDVLVENSRGKVIPDLTQQDFTVTDNGKPRKIDIFSFNRADTEHPRTAAPTALKAGEPKTFFNRAPGPPDISAHSTVIVLDQVNAFFEDAGYGRQQVLNLIGKVKPDERIAIYVIVRRVGLAMIQDYTTDHALLRRSLSKWLPRGLMARPIFPVGWPVSIQDLPAGQARPPDAVKVESPREAEFAWQRNSETARLSLQTLAEQLAHVPGRKNVYWVTQAFPARQLQMGWDKTLASLNEANVAVNTVDSRGLFVGSAPAGGTLATMQHIAEETGGTAYFNRNDMDTAMAEGIESSRVSYTLGFYLGDSDRDGSFHELKVKASRSGLQLFYRRGYYAGSTELPPDKNLHSDLESALLNPVTSDGIGIAAHAEITPQKTINLRLSLDPSTLSLKDGKGKVEETVVEQNESGKFLVKMHDDKQFEIGAANRQDFDHKGVSWLFPIPLVDGAVKITIMMRDMTSGRIGTVVIPLNP